MLFSKYTYLFVQDAQDVRRDGGGREVSSRLLQGRIELDARHAVVTAQPGVQEGVDVF